MNVFGKTEVVGFFLNEYGFETIGEYGTKMFMFFIKVNRVGCLEPMEDDSERVVSNLDLKMKVVGE